MMQLYQMTRKIMKTNTQNNMNAYASSAAFFIFLALIPMLLCVSTIIPYTGMTQNTLILLASEVLPAPFVGFAITLISEMYHRSPALLSVAVLMLIWSAAKGMLALMRSFQVIYQVEETRNYFVLRFLASIYTAFLMAGIVLTLVIMVFGNHVVEFLVSIIPRISLILAVISYFKYFIFCIFLTFLFMISYSKIPNKKIRFKEQFPGALFASIGWLVFSWCFSLYVNYFNAFNIYGSLSTIIMVMLWIYICMYILMIGAQVNVFLEEKT